MTTIEWQINHGHTFLSMMPMQMQCRCGGGGIWTHVNAICNGSVIMEITFSSYSRPLHFEIPNLIGWNPNSSIFFHPPGKWMKKTYNMIQISKDSFPTMNPNLFVIGFWIYKKNIVLHKVMSTAVPKIYFSYPHKLEILVLYSHGPKIPLKMQLFQHRQFPNIISNYFAWTSI